MNQGVLTGILKWSLSQGSGLQPDDGDVKPMSEEDAEFLVSAFESVTIDEVQRMKLIASVLQLPEERAQLDALTQRSTAFVDDLQRVAKGVTEGQGVAVHPGMIQKDKQQKKRRSWQKDSSGGEQKAADAQRPLDGAEEAPGQPQQRPPLDVDALLHEVIVRKEGALDELDDRVLSLDNAVDLHTVGGFPPLLAALSSAHAGVRWRAAQALATITQNNPRCQRFAYDLHALTPLLAIIASPPSSSSPPPPTSPSSAPSHSVENEWLCVVKALYALSSLIRGPDTPAASDFLRQSGLESLVLLLQHEPHPPPRVVAKALGLLRFLVERERDAGGQAEGVGEVMSKMGVWSAVKDAIGVEDINVREEALRLLARCSEERGMRRAIEREPGLLARLQSRLIEIEQLPAEERERCEDERGLAQGLRHTLSSSSPS